MQLSHLVFSKKHGIMCSYCVLEVETMEKIRAFFTALNTPLLITVFKVIIIAVVQAKFRREIKLALKEM